MARGAVLAASAALLLCTLCVATSAGRLPDPFEGAWGQQFDVSQNLQGLLSHVSRSHKEHEGSRKVAVATRYLVPGRHACEFVKEWRKLEKSVLNESGNIVFDLKKTLTDNIVFVGYAEWEKKEDLGAHVEGKALRDFVEFLTKNDIVVKVEPLYAGCSKDDKRSHDVSKGERDPVSILSKFIVRPHSEWGFIKEWEETVAAAHKTKGNRVYSLKKVLTDNLSFYLYSSWEKFEDFADFLKSKDTRKFGEFVEEHDIVFFTAPLKKLGDQPE